MANRSLQAKTLKMRKQNAMRPYEYDTRVIVLRDKEKHIPAQVARPLPERKTAIVEITSQGKGPSRTPIFNATDWSPATRLYRNGELVA